LFGKQHVVSIVLVSVVLACVVLASVVLASVVLVSVLVNVVLGLLSEQRPSPSPSPSFKPLRLRSNCEPPLRLRLRLRLSGLRLRLRLRKAALLRGREGGTERGRGLAPGIPLRPGRSSKFRIWRMLGLDTRRLGPCDTLYFCAFSAS